jgi:hypothetical protein
MRSSIKKSLSFVFLLFLFTFLFNMTLSAPVFAQGNLLDGQTGIDDVKKVFGEPEDIRITIAKIINIILSLLAAIFLILVIIAGFKYMTAAGNEEKVKESIKQIQQAVIGLIIILMAWGITRFIMIRLLAAASGQNYLYFN